MSTGQLRSIAIAAREAVSGADETLWQACMTKLREIGKYEAAWDNRFNQELIFEESIRSMSSEERALYGVSDE